MRTILTIVVGLVVAAGVAAGVMWMRQSQATQAAARSESEQEGPEVAACNDRLKAIYSAWKRYKDDHHGATPPSVEALIPKYIKDPKELVCPTAARWEKNGHPLDSGNITIDKKKYSVTYGFKWLAAGYARAEKAEGSRAPLVVCNAHREAIFRAEHPHAAANAIYNEPAKEPGSGPGAILVVRTNGETGTLQPNEE